MAEFSFLMKDRLQEKPPSICTKFWSEFKGTQMKLSQFVVRTKREREEESLVEEEITEDSKPVKIEVRIVGNGMVPLMEYTVILG